MKLPTSSSILIATLAISSSSSCLAAPAGPLSQDADMSKHSSTNQASCMPSATPASHFGGGQHERTIQERYDIMMERSADASYLERRDGSNPVDPLIKLINGLPVVGPALGKILTPLLTKTTVGAQSLDTSGSGSTQNIDPQDMAALQSAIQEVSRALGTNYGSVPAPVQGAVGSIPSVVGSVASGLPLPSNPIAGALSDGDSASAGAGSSSSVSSDAPGPTTAAAAAPSASGSPSSPPMPGNPPNTPALALPGNSGLPVSAPV